MFTGGAGYFQNHFQMFTHHRFKGTCLRSLPHSQLVLAVLEDACLLCPETLQAHPEGPAAGVTPGAEGAGPHWLLKSAALAAQHTGLKAKVPLTSIAVHAVYMSVL